MSNESAATPATETPKRPYTPNGSPAPGAAASAGGEQTTSARPGRWRRWTRRLLAPVRALRRVPRAARVCALIAWVSAASWSLVTPPFQAPDEPSHFSYTQTLAETGQLPSSNATTFSQAEEAAMQGLRLPSVIWHPERRTIATRAQQQRLKEYLALPLARTDNGDAGVAASEPPLYYALQVIPYDIGVSSGTLLDSIALMRLLSSLMAAFTALFVFMFVREALPGAPWAWTVAGLSVALAPLLGFMSGVINPDAMLYAVSAATFFCLARGFRRGLTPRLALALGAVTAIGLLTKLNYLGLVPGVLVGAVVLVIRARRSGRLPLRFYGSLLLALAIPATPVAAYVAKNLLSHRAGLGLVSNAASLTSARESLGGEIRYLWEFYLPRLPWMANEFPGISTTRDIWFNRSVGLYGWLDTLFPPWLYTAALLPAGLIAVLAARSLLVGRAALRRRLGELLTYAVLALGLMALLASDSYLNMKAEGAGWAQPRYLLPLIPLVAALVALAARGAGRRWGPAVGVLIVTLVLAQDLFSQLQTVARFYG
jgi:Predicted membrane protein (DUF2142)